ncbi:MAG: hypothetical protein WBD99_11400 [Thermodesulfobacteriota bacterium]
MAKIKIQVNDSVNIRGNNSIRIGDGRQVFETNFNIPQRDLSTGYQLQHSYLTYMIKGLTVATTNPDIRINNQIVGQIQRAHGADPNHWFTQTVTIARGNTYPIPLRQGTNELEIRAVTYPSANAGDLFDDFFLRNIILTYTYFINVDTGLF